MPVYIVTASSAAESLKKDSDQHCPHEVLQTEWQALFWLSVSVTCHPPAQTPALSITSSVNYFRVAIACSLSIETRLQPFCKTRLI